MSEQNIDTLLNRPDAIIILALAAVLVIAMGFALGMYALRFLFKRGTPSQIDATNVSGSLSLASDALKRTDRIEQAILNNSETVKAIADAQKQILDLEGRSIAIQESFSGKLDTHETAAKGRSDEIQRAILDLGNFLNQLAEAVSAQTKHFNTVAELPLRILKLIEAAESPEEIQKLSEHLRAYSEATGEIARKTTKPLVMTPEVQAKFDQEGKEENEKQAE